MIVLHKVFRFCAAHRYWNPAWCPEANEAAFGEDIHLHGHNYTLIISVCGDVDEETGFVVDLGRLKRVVADKVVKVLDHKQIELDVPWFQTRRPSTENLVRWIRDQLVAEDLGCRLVRVRLHETDSIYTDWQESPATE